MNFVMITAFLGYFSILITIGVYFYHKTRNATSYMVGNRSVNYWVTAIATQASDMGSWLFLGLPAAVYTCGLPEYWTTIGLVVGMYTTWQFVAPQLRVQSAQQKSLTLASFLADKANDQSGLIHLVAACITLLFFSFYIASGLVGLTVMFESAFGMPYHLGMFASVITVASYTLIGGFLAVAWCDFLQGMFLAVAIALVPLVTLFTMGGIQPILTAAHERGLSLVLITSARDTLAALALAAGWGLGYFGQPHILMNFMGIDNPKNITYAKRIGITWQIIVLTSSTAIGLVGIGFFAQPIAGELVFIKLTTSLFHPFAAGLVLCAILAATLSTLDSLLLLSGSTVAEDLYKQLINPHVSSQQQVLISRLASIGMALVTTAIAVYNHESIYFLVNYAWAGLGSSFGPLVLVSLYTKHVHKTAALAGMLTGALVSGTWPLLKSPLLPLVPGFLASLSVIVLLQKRYTPHTR